MKKSTKAKTLDRFIYSAHGQEEAPRVLLLSDGFMEEGPFELPVVSRVPLSSWLVAGALSFMVFMGVNAGRADAMSSQAEPEGGKGIRQAVVNPADGSKSFNEYLPVRVNLVTSTPEELDRLFAHTNVAPHTNVAYTDVQWQNHSNIVSHTNTWSNHQNSSQEHVNIDPGTPGGGGGIIY